MKQSEIESFDQDYIETEIQPMKFNPSKVLLRERTKKAVTAIRGRVNNIPEKLKLQRKPVKKLTKNQRKAIQEQRKSVILGIGLLSVVVSIAYSTTVTYVLVDSIASRVAMLPQTIFAIYISYKAFSKLYK